MTSRARIVVAAALVMTTTIGCSQGGDDSAEPTGDRPTLVAPVGTSQDQLQDAAGVVRSRLARMGAPEPAVSVVRDGLLVSGATDPFQLEAAARGSKTTINVVESSTLGPCADEGSPPIGQAQRCYQIGEVVAGIDAIAQATPRPAESGGWEVALSIDSAQYAEFRDAVWKGDPQLLAVVADGIVLLAFKPGLPGQRSTLGPELTQEDARRVAAALAVDEELAFMLEAPPAPELDGPEVAVDFWTAALGVWVCGAWLPNAPNTSAELGLHSHADGLIYVHPTLEREAGANATARLFLDGGGWEISADHLRLWDAIDHRNGAACPDGRPGRVRWWVDGVAQRGDPGSWRVRNGQVIVWSFGPDEGDPGLPPQASALHVPALRAVPE